MKKLKYYFMLAMVGLLIISLSFVLVGCGKKKVVVTLYQMTSIEDAPHGLPFSQPFWNHYKTVAIEGAYIIGFENIDSGDNGLVSGRLLVVSLMSNGEWSGGTGQTSPVEYENSNGVITFNLEFFGEQHKFVGTISGDIMTMKYYHGDIHIYTATLENFEVE